MPKARKAATAENSALRTPHSEPSVPPAGIPPGVDADVETKIKYKRRVDPDRLDRDSDNGLGELAASEAEFLSPPDPLSEFTDEWRRFAGYTLMVARLPDPATRRMPGKGYNRPASFDVERLGGIPFDPINLTEHLQFINGNSGGVFRVWLVDEGGNLIPGAVADRVCIADPIGFGAGVHSNVAGGVADAARNVGVGVGTPAPKSALEKQIESLQARLLESALDRVLNPPPPPVAPGPTLPVEDQLTLHLVREGGLLKTAVDRVVSLVQAPENAAKETGWRDRLVDAGIEIFRNDPQLMDRVTGTIERIVSKVLPGRDRVPSTPNSELRTPEYLPPPAPRAPAPPPARAANPVEVEIDDNDEPEEEEDEELMDIVQELFILLNSNKPLTKNDPIFVQLNKDFPVKFRVALRLIATQPLDDVIAWVSEKAPLYENLLSSPATGPFLRGRLSELQQLCQSESQKAAAAAAPPIPQAPIEATAENSKLRTPHSEP